MRTRGTALAGFVLLVAAIGLRSEEKGGEWKVLFNGKDTTGWTLRSTKITQTKFVDADGKTIPGGRMGKVGQKEEARDAKNKVIADAKIVSIKGKKTVVDADGKPIAKAKVALVGGRNAVVDAKGNEVKGAKAVTVTTDNPSGWTVEKETLVCSKPHGGNDLLTEAKFTDFELHVEFQATSNSGVYLQGRYEIQIDNSFGRPVSKGGCGALYSLIAPSKNMSKKPMEWQTFAITFHAPRGEKGKVTKKARVTLVWNGEKVIDNAEIAGPTGGALDGKVLEAGPILLQGDHGRVAFRNIKIRPLSSK
jgi:hypothetical protein